jgi:hypothetical protein
MSNIFSPSFFYSLILYHIYNSILEKGSIKPNKGLTEKKRKKERRKAQLSLIAPIMPI